MSNINSIKLGSVTYPIIAQGIPYGEVDSTSTDTAFTASIPSITEYTDGTTVLLKNGVVTSASGFTININGLGAKPVYSNMATGNPITPTNPTRETTIFNINYTLLLIYSSTIVDGGGWINYRGYDSNTNTLAYQLYRERNNGVMANALYRYQIVFTQKDGKFMAANTTSNSTATTKTLSTLAFDPFQPIFYYASTTDLAAAGTPDATYLYEQRYDVDLRYAFNAGKTLTANKAVYIKCSPQADGTVKFSGKTCITQTLPSSADGYVYIYLGKSYSTYQIVLDIYHPIYEYKNGRLGLWTNIDTDTDTDTVTNIYPSLSSGVSVATFNKTDKSGAVISGSSGTIYAPTPSTPTDYGLTSITFTSPTSGWSSGSQPTCSVSVSGIYSSTHGILGVNGSLISADQYRAAQKANIVVGAVGSGSITLKALRGTPTMTIPMLLEVQKNS